MGVLGQRELQRITTIVVSPRIIKGLRVNVTIVERRPHGKGPSSKSSSTDIEICTKYN